MRKQGLSRAARRGAQPRRLVRGFEILERRAMMHAAPGAAPDSGEGEAISGDIVPDFALVDVNPTSSTFDQALSPRDYLQQATAWYFGHST